MIHKRANASVVRLFGVATGLITITGCQTYEPKPLDQTSHRQIWQERTPSGDEVGRFALSLYTPGSAKSTNFDPSDGLTVSEGNIIALVFNPELRLARLRARVVKAKAPYAGRWQDPIFNLNILKIAESIPDPWYVSSSLSLTLPVSGRLGAKKMLAAAEIIHELERIAEAEWNVLKRLRESWLSWSAKKLKINQIEAFIDKLDAVIESTKLLADSGELLKTEAVLFVIERESMRAKLEQLRSSLEEEVQNIRSLMGLSPKAPLVLIASLTVLNENPEDLLRLDRNPTLARFRSEYEVAERTLLVEVRKQYPDLTIGPQVENETRQSRIGFAGGIPLPILNSNKEGIMKARAERDLARAAFETAYERMAGQLAVLQARLNGIHIRQNTMEKTIVPMVDQQVVDAYQLLSLGERGSLVMLESLVRTCEIKLKLIDAQLEASITQNAINFLIGPINDATTAQNYNSLP